MLRGDLAVQDSGSAGRPAGQTEMRAQEFRRAQPSFLAVRGCARLCGRRQARPGQAGWLDESCVGRPPARDIRMSGDKLTECPYLAIVLS